MLKKSLLETKNANDIIELIRDLGGTIFVDPCPPTQSVGRSLSKLLGRIFKK